MTTRWAAAPAVVVSLSALGSPPRLVSATPDLGDADVDPTTTELRLEFDQDMDTRGGMAFPPRRAGVERPGPRGGPAGCAGRPDALAVDVVDDEVQPLVNGRRAAEDFVVRAGPGHRDPVVVDTVRTDRVE
jgi:hypothetical protein